MKVEPAEQARVFGALLAEVSGLIDALGLRHMLIGGLAVAVRGRVRATKDIDFAIAADSRGVSRLLEALKDRGFAATVHGAPGPGAVMRFLQVGPAGVERRVDILCAGTPFEESAITRADACTLFGQTVPVVSLDDLLVYKLIANRAEDRADFVELVKRNPGRVDEAYVSARAAEWDRSEALAALLQEAREAS